MTDLITAVLELNSLTLIAMVWKLKKHIFKMSIAQAKHKEYFLKVLRDF